ncbi:nucleotide-diphospho-sugar transferase [Dyadobacter sandarakinus]|nr:nucleotide-diphospho-sugar transferase [Dyadobacter sandarakinus]
MLYQQHNLGCKAAVSGAIKWFFSNEPEGIILEDDCLPNESFFRFCDLLLEKYRFDTRIVHISGACLGHEKKFGRASYYFSKITNIWGWASWRRAWQNYDENLMLLENFLKDDLFKYVYENKAVTNRLIESLHQVHTMQLNTWDVQYAFLNFWNNGLCINPNFNMVSNIGFGHLGTHTKDSTSKFANLPLEEIGQLVHPDFFVPIVEADYYVYKKELPTIAERVSNKLKRLLGLALL